MKNIKLAGAFAILAINAISLLPVNAVAEQTQASNLALKGFSPFIGSWEGEGDRPFQIAVRWARKDKLLNFIERGGFGGDDIVTFAEGFIGQNPASHDIISRVFFIQRDYMADGEWSNDSSGVLINHFTAHYGDGWGSVEAGSTVRFRDTWTSINKDRWKWETEIFRDGGWMPLSDVVLNRMDADLFSFES